MDLNEKALEKLKLESNEVEIKDLNQLESNISLEEEALPQLKSQEIRVLTNEEILKLEKDKKLVPEFKHKKLEQDAKKNWDLFYRRNKTNFFKDRYWTFREFDELNYNEESPSNKTLLEIGCGVGNFMYPLLKHNKHIFVYACDFSTDAIQLLKSNEDYDETRCYGFVCDLTKENSLKDSLPANVMVDIVTLIFVLSAIHPEKMQKSIENISKILRPGGICLLRDYGVNDHSMIRFEPGHKLDDKFYARQDGTRTFFFSLEELDSLFLKSYKNENSSNTFRLFDKSINEYVFRETINIKENLKVPRVFVQSKFIRTNYSI